MLCAYTVGGAFNPSSLVASYCARVIWLSAAMDGKDPSCTLTFERVPQDWNDTKKNKHEKTKRTPASKRSRGCCGRCGLYDNKQGWLVGMAFNSWGTHPDCKSKEHFWKRLPMSSRFAELVVTRSGGCMILPIIQNHTSEHIDPRGAAA